MELDINWLMGFIEAKSCFTISQQKIKTSRYRKLSKEVLIQKIGKLLSELPELPESPPKIALRYQELSEFLSDLPKRKLIDLFKKLLAIKSLSIKQHPINSLDKKAFEYFEYDYFARPAFFLTFQTEDLSLINCIKDFFTNNGMSMNGPYKINKGKYLRLELKGIDNCLKLYRFLTKKKWYTSKKENFEQWGKKIIEISTNKKI